MEQGIHENSTVLLRFKFYNFYNLSPKVRNCNRKTLDFFSDFLVTLSCLHTFLELPKLMTLGCIRIKKYSGVPIMFYQVSVS